MSYIVFMSSLLVAWLAFEFYLLWLNYKGRFRYKLKEAWKPQKQLQKIIGVVILPVTLLCSLTIIWLAPPVIAVLFNMPYTVAFPSVVCGWLGLRVLNVYADRSTIKEFETHCLKCENKEECNRFLNEKCSREYLKHFVRMAVEYNKDTER